LGVSAGIANLDVHYDRSGLTVRTGWSRTAGGAAATDPAGASTPVPKNATAVTPWRVDLDALEHRLRTEFHAVSNASAAAVARDEKSLAGSDTQLLRKVRMLLEESERKQRNELALGLAQVVQEFDAKRGTDLADIRTLKNAQTATGVEIVRTQQYVDLLRRASLQR
jgi:hypothetical protein